MKPLDPRVLTTSILIAASCSAEPFVLNSIQPGCSRGGGGGDRCVYGSPIYCTRTFYQHDFGNNYPPLAAFVKFIPGLEEDSYIAMDPVGPSTATYTANGPGGSTPGDSATYGHFLFGNTALAGGWFTGGGVDSGIDPWGGSGLMVAHLTTHGELYTWAGSGVRVNLDELGTLELPLNGPSTQGFSLRTYVTPSQFDNGKRHQIWVTDQPVPPRGCPGDANRDGSVDFADLELVLETWNLSLGAGQGGDVTEDEHVDFADLELVLADWGETCTK